MMLDRKAVLGTVALLALLLGAATSHAAGVPAWLPRYDVVMDVDVPGHQVAVQMRATWTNPTPTPTDKLVFNAHSHYVVPDSQIGLMAKTLEILRVNPSEELGEKEPACEVRKVTLIEPATVVRASQTGTNAAPTEQATDAPFHYEGDTNTGLVVPLSRPVRQGESVTVVLDIHMKLPQKQGRWGQWRGVTFLTNWLPVFAYYGDPPDPHPGDEDKAADDRPGWQPTPFVAWHLPFFNEAGVYQVHLTVPVEQHVACTGSIVTDKLTEDGHRELDIRAEGVRDFAFLCSAEYKEFATVLEPRVGVSHPIRVHVLALPQHEHYAKETLRIACDALTIYGKWFGPYPYDDFTVAESFFGWNGNQCGMLVMIDERVFGLPQVAGGFVDYLISHEICHQWWYNAVGVNGYAESFMDEGLATYFSKRMINQTVGRDSYMMNYPQGLEWLPNVRRQDYHAYGMYGTIARGDNGPIVQDMDKFGHIVNLFSMAYDKGARVMGMIEERMGEAAFLDCMRGIYGRYQYRVLRVADFRRELEAYTGTSWRDFFRDWLYGPGLTDWAVDDVVVQPPPLCAKLDVLGCKKRRLAKAGPNKLADADGKTRVVVMLRQKAQISEQTTLGFAVKGCDGYPIRIPIAPQAHSYQIDEPPASVEVLPDDRVRVEVLLPEEPTQIAVDPDQILIDKDPSNNFWKPPVRFRFAPIYTFLEESDLTNFYDRWNIIVGPWVYGSIYDDPWYTRSTMAGLRAGLYRTQQFDGGVYGAYRTDYRDVVVGADALWEHVLDPHIQVGVNVERRLTTTLGGDENAFRGVLFGRYIFMDGDSLYLPAAHYIETFASFQQNFLPFPKQSVAMGERFDQTSTGGVHYRLDYLTPYWNPEGGFKLDLVYEGGVAGLNRLVALNKASAQFSTVSYLPDLNQALSACPRLQEAARPALTWLADTRVAVRLYGATGLPAQGEFFTMGGDALFRGYDQSQRQGSTVWVGSVEWRVPLVTGLTWDAFDHVVGLRNIYGAAFYDIGDAYTSGRSAGPVAHAVGGGVRLDVTWFGFVERTMLRFDVAQTINGDAPTQFMFGVGAPF
jgi:Peptidase family M1 domain